MNHGKAAEQDEVLGIGAASAPAQARSFHAEPKHFHFAPIPLTPAMALAEARNLIAHPHMIFHENTARRVITALLEGIDSSSCFAKALANGEDTFVLRSCDKAAPAAIRVWAAVADEHGCRIEKTGEARLKAERWEALAGRKWPD